MTTKSRPLVFALVTGFILVLGLGLFFVKDRHKFPAVTTPSPTPPPPPVNIIPVSDRPFVVLAPKTSRNDLDLAIENLTKPAEEVEVSLEYDRNKGVWDAVLKQFFLKTGPFSETIFLGSKSAGGHITYHEDVVGGKLLLKFMGKTGSYALEVPWLYNDTQTEFKQVSTQDGKFQAVFVKPLKTPKIIVMQSPGLPKHLDGTIIAGPYLIRAVGLKPDTSANIQIRLSEDAPQAQLYGWDGTAWVKVPAQVTGKTLTADTPFYLAWVVVK